MSETGLGVNSYKNMRILLTLPHNEFYKRNMPDLGLGYLAACLKKKGHEVQLFLNVKELQLLN